MNNLAKIPAHIAFIMDGNGRWAEAKNMPRSKGHLAGIKAMQRIIESCAARGIKYISLFAFSTENWARSEEEINNLFEYVRQFINKQAKKYIELNYVVRFIGNLDGLPSDIREGCKKIYKESKNCDGLNVCIYLNYGGRNDIINACNALLEQSQYKISQKQFEKELYTNGLPPPDLLIRTGGEKRLSNFMLYQLAYTELMFLDCYWPDFDEIQLKETLTEYSLRTRKFGG